jgi:stage V sporulation protein D (sporulation-specific penicillin-binding protein)
MTSDGTVETETIAAVPGNTVVSTIDLNIQKIIEEQITNYMTETGAETIGVIAMDPDNGEILAMASSNNYDLNSPGDTSALRNSCITIEEEVPVSSTEEEADDEDSTEEVETETVETTFNFNEMSDDEFANTIAGLSDDQKELLLNQLWRNYCVADAYEPGSTFKTFTIAGALEENVVQDGQTFYCDGYEIKGNYTIKCHNYTIGGCGLLTLGQTLEQSCNDSLMQIAELEGAVIFDKYQNLFGFGSKTGIDLPGETSGLKYDADSLNSTELATSSFGQSVSVNMVQMTAAFCSVINGGNYYEPHVVKQILNSEGTVVSENDGQLVRKTISKETSELMKTYLYGVVTDGTGKKAAVDGYTIGGKTGTAEKKGRDKTNYVLSFIGFSPVEDPQIVLYVVVDSPNVESQSTSGAGALLFHDIMEELLPYLNIYQSSDETIVSTGDEDEPLESLIDDGTSEDDNSEESTTEEGATEENTTEEATSEVSHDE